jgi:hypothetical protein
MQQAGDRTIRLVRDIILATRGDRIETLEYGELVRGAA